MKKFAPPDWITETELCHVVPIFSKEIVFSGTYHDCWCWFRDNTMGMSYGFDVVSDRNYQETKDTRGKFFEDTYGPMSKQAQEFSKIIKRMKERFNDKATKASR